MPPEVTMLNRDVFQTPPEQYRLANQGVAKISFPPLRDGMETLRSELSTFVCDGAYAGGLARILNAFLGSEYTFWGYGVLRDLIGGREWYRSGHFPRVSGG